MTDYQTLRCVLALLAGGLSAYLAKRAGKNTIQWFGIGAFLGFFGILPIFFLPTLGRKKAKGGRSTVKQKMFYLTGPVDKLWYYVDLEGKQQGPLSLNALSEAWRSQKIHMNTYVWNEELPDWKPLQSFIQEQ